jgi:hypothetical protein
MLISRLPIGRMAGIGELVNLFYALHPAVKVGIFVLIAADIYVSFMSGVPSLLIFQKSADFEM